MDTAIAITNLLAGALTPIIAIIAVYIARQQCKTARSKLKLDLYDRRFKVYRGLVDLFAAVLQDGKVSQNDLANYYVETSEKKFLFDNDIVEFMTKVREQAVELRQIIRRMENLPKGQEDELHELSEKDAELFSWFDKQLELAPQKFEKYLGFKTNL